MSQITSSVTNTPAAAAAHDGAQPNPAETAEQFEGLLWSSVLAPLSASLGPLGDVFTNALGATVARGQHDEFYQHLRALVELSNADGARPTDGGAAP